MNSVLASTSMRPLQSKQAAPARVQLRGAARPLQAARAPQRGVMSRATRRVVAVASASEEEDIALLEKMLERAKSRAAAAPAEASSSSDGGEYSGASFNIQTFNAISPVGLDRYEKGKYKVSPDVGELENNPMAIMLRSHKLQEEEVAATVRCIARCGAGTNNIPVAKMTELGIPVFNTPGANANAVKELVVCSLLLASRGILEGHNHVNNVINPEENNDYAKVAKRIEGDKAMFVGQEIAGKTLGVVGLGQIGARVVEAALALGMQVLGYDPALSVEAALMLPGDRLRRVEKLEDLLAASDYISLHTPYIPGVTHHLLNPETLKQCRPGVHLLNFARGEIVDGAALKAAWDSGAMTGKYIADFTDADLMGHPRHIVLPHLGASTGEAEENSAAMAADTIKSYLETGSIRHSVNFPAVSLPYATGGIKARLCIVNQNTPGVLGAITTFLGDNNINIVQQVNVSRGDIAYTVIDMGDIPANPDQLQTDLASTCEGVISSRFLSDPFNTELGKPGTFYQVTWDESNNNNN
jgi:D-3-phosphoglycerate dehydrogenase